jgi:hypothetical protein
MGRSRVERVESTGHMEEQQGAIGRRKTFA